MTTTKASINDATDGADMSIGNESSTLDGGSSWIDVVEDETDVRSNKKSKK